MTLTHAPQLAPHYPDTRADTPEPTTIRILLVDDHPAVRRRARALIDDQPDMSVVAEASSVAEALDKLKRPFDVAIIDYHLGDSRDGLSLIAHLKSRQPTARALVYSAFADGALAITALIAGADGLLGKHELGEELCTAVRRVARGRQHLPAISQPVAHAMRSRLQPRDKAIFAMLLHGVAPEVIADRLGITSRELEARRVTILSSLKPTPALSGLPAGARAPLDYERARRHRHYNAA
ncbi:MAG: response regulator [Solirubrobacteraceae bacterium]